MKIAYEHDGKKWTLHFGKQGRWSGGHPGFAHALNHAFAETVGRHEYYPTPWHRVKHLADLLGGTVDTPEPPYETGESDGKVFAPR